MWDGGGQWGRVGGKCTAYTALMLSGYCTALYCNVLYCTVLVEIPTISVPFRQSFRQFFRQFFRPVPSVFPTDWYKPIFNRPGVARVVQ